MFRKVLIANRGEIARPCHPGCQERGVRTVAVYSDATGLRCTCATPTRRTANRPAPARESYLNIPAIIEVAGRAGAEAIHPGYGFLSENGDSRKP